MCSEFSLIDDWHRARDLLLCAVVLLEVSLVFGHLLFHYVLHYSAVEFFAEALAWLVRVFWVVQQILLLRLSFLRITLQLRVFIND